MRTFGLARPVLRWLERLLGHDLALRELAERRAEVYAALVPLVPGRLGRRRGDLLASVVDDVDALLDERLRVRAPLWTWLGTSAAHERRWRPGCCPTAGAVLLGAALAGGALAWLTGLAGARRTAPVEVAARAALSRRVLELVADARPLGALAGHRARRSTGSPRRPTGAHGAARRRTRWVATARLWPAARRGGRRGGHRRRRLGQRRCPGRSARCWCWSRWRWSTWSRRWPTPAPCAATPGRRPAASTR